MSESTIPIDLLTPKDIKLAQPITTAERIVVRQFIPAANARADAPSPSKKARFGNSSAFQGGGIPPSPMLLHISDAFQPSVGVYLLPSSTGSGKSILSSAMVAWANDTGTPASYVYVFEPRAATFAAGKSVKFKDPANFVTDAETLFKLAGPTTSGRLVVFDSATLPLKAYARNFPYQATFPGGSQPSDRGFLDEMSRLATLYSACIILPLNSTLVPYASDLLGAVEGMISITDVMNFTISDRTSYSARTPKAMKVPLDYVNAALSAWNFQPYSKGSATSMNSSRSGIYAKRNQ